MAAKPKLKTRSKTQDAATEARSDRKTVMDWAQQNRWGGLDAFATGQGEGGESVETLVASGGAPGAQRAA